MEKRPAFSTGRGEGNPSAGLADQPVDLSVALLSENDHLASALLHPFEGLTHALLELKHNRAGAVNHLEAVAPGELIGLRRLPVSADEKHVVLQILHLADGQNLKPLRPEPVKLHRIVHDGAQRTEPAAVFQIVFRLFDRPDDSVAEA